MWAMPENTAWLPGVFTTAGPIVSLFETLVGPFPYEKLAHVQSSTRFGGMENASEIFYDGKLFDTQKMSDGLIAHETAWISGSGTLSPNMEWGHVWLSEGFATYFAALWTRSYKGDSAFRAEMNGIRKQVIAAKVVAERPVIDTAQTDLLALLNTNSYQKGGYILYMLHEQMGDSAFFAGIQSYYAKYRNGNALTDDLRAELEESSGLSLKPFFDQWLRRPGFAELTVGWAYDAEEGKISVRVLQQDQRCIPLATSVVCEGNKVVPFALSLPVVVTDASGKTTRVVVDIPASRTSAPRCRCRVVIQRDHGPSPSIQAIDCSHVLPDCERARLESCGDRTRRSRRHLVGVARANARAVTRDTPDDARGRAARGGSLDGGGGLVLLTVRTCHTRPRRTRRARPVRRDEGCGASRHGADRGSAAVRTRSGHGARR